MKEGDEDIALNLPWTPRKMDTFFPVFQTSTSMPSLLKMVWREHIRPGFPTFDTLLWDRLLSI